MRNLFKSIVCVAAAALMATACVKEQDFGREYADASEYISFYSSLSAETGVSTKSVASTFTCEEEDWPLLAKKADTKAAPATGLSGNAGLIGYSYDTWDEASTLPWTAYFYNTEYSFSNERLSATGTPVQWIRSTEDYLKVFAYAPKSFVDGAAATLSASSATGTPTITYTVPSDPAEQVDLIGATATVAGNYKNSIPLSFDHALTAVRFKIGYACTVKSVSLQGVKDYGVYAIGGSWSSLSGVATYSFTFNGGSGTAFAADAFLNDDANTLMLLPQDLTASSQIVLVYDDGEEHTATFSLEGMSWPAGKRVTYTLQKNEIEYIYFDLAAGDVTILPNGSEYKYKGYVYTNRNGTKVEVSGKHLTSNEYYVYQSTSTNRNSTGWSGAVGSTMIVPSYSEVRSPDGTQSWGDYVTNNSHSEDIIGLWNLDYDYELEGTYKSRTTHPVEDVSRTACNNYFLFLANATAGELFMNMTIDNIWVDWTSGFNVSAKPNPLEGSTSTTLYTNDTPGTFAPFFLNGANQPNVGLTLKLKGDNFIPKFLFDTRHASDYFRITSSEGDGSSEGSLTVTPPFNRKGTNDSNYIMPNSSVDLFCSTQTRNLDQYGLEFRGGTVYVATPLYLKNNASSWVFSCLGGCSNTHIHMAISGGRLTAVAHSTGPAIGGGSGGNYLGGNGHIDITGGQVYAYQYGTGTENSDYRYAVTATAIGGGSSLHAVANGGYVNISNDAYVYAESVGGVAIGGGSSGGATGGESDIHITGNPTVIAKSVPGTIREKWKGGVFSVQPGVAIGGGNGGDETYRFVNPSYYTYEDSYANGGIATINIEGGTIYTGSIGGGKNGVDDSDNPRNIGWANIEVSGGNIQGQFIMQAGDDTNPTFTMSGGTIDNSNLQTAGGFNKIQANGGAVFIGNGINPGIFTMTGGTIRNSSATYGGAVYQEGGSFRMEGGTIESSSATSGGALYVFGGSVSMSGGVIQQCSSSSHGGAMYMAGGSVSISGGDIHNNSASGTGADGGGIYISKGSFTMPALGTGLIRNNYAKNDGGGVYITSEDDNVTVDVLSGSITGNTSDYRGGGLCVLPGGGYAANITLGIADQGDSNPNISGNESALSGGGLYAEGTDANIRIYSGNIRGNNVSAYVANNDIANEGGMVNLYGGDVDYRTVTFNANGGVGADQIQKIVTATNTHLAVPAAAQDFTKADHHLTGWNTLPGGGGTSYAINDTRVMNISENITLYAQWAAD